MQIQVYSDGSATTKDKPGGYGYVIVIDGIKHSEGSDFLPNASNNDAEMEASIQGLGATLKLLLNSPQFTPHLTTASVTLISDSQLILGWASGTFKFKQLDKIPKYNQLISLMTRLNAKTKWIRGHSGEEFNERCDQLANEARLGYSKQKKIKEAKATGESIIGTKKEGIVCIWYKGVLKLVDLSNDLVENHNREIHGPRGSAWEIREDKKR